MATNSTGDSDISRSIPKKRGRPPSAHPRPKYRNELDKEYTDARKAKLRAEREAASTYTGVEQDAEGYSGKLSLDDLPEPDARDEIFTYTPLPPLFSSPQQLELGVLDWRDIFLRQLQSTGNPIRAAKLAGVTFPIANRTRGLDKEFAEWWDTVLLERVAALEQWAYERAKENDAMLVFLLKKLRPDVYGDKQVSATPVNFVQVFLPDNSRGDRGDVIEGTSIQVALPDNGREND